MTEPTLTAAAATTVTADGGLDKQSAELIGLLRGLPDKEERGAAEGDALPLER